MSQYFEFPGRAFEKDGKLWVAIDWVKGQSPAVVPAPLDWPADRPAGWSGTVTLYTSK